MRVVVTAPSDKPLDIGALVRASGSKSLSSVVTALHARPAGRLIANADGSVSIGAGAPETASGNLIEGGLVVFDAGRLSLHTDQALSTLPAVTVLEARQEPPLPALLASPLQRTASPAPVPVTAAMPPATISIGSFGISAGGNITINGASGITTAGGSLGAGGTIPITSPSGVALQGGSISVGGNALAPAGSISGGGNIVVR